MTTTLSGPTCERVEQPEHDARPSVTLERHLLHEAAQVVQALRGHVVEVDQMADRVKDGEEERRTRHDLVELDVGVDGDVLVDRVVFHQRQDVAGHGQQEQGEAEGEGGGRSSGDSDADSHHVAQVGVFCQETVVCGGQGTRQVLEVCRTAW